MVWVRYRLRLAIIACAATLVGLVFLICAGIAKAGEYQVYACRTPSGVVLPVEATGGWVGSVESGGSFDDYVVDTCASGGALIAALGDATNHDAGPDKATWMLSAPSTEAITEGALWVAGDDHGTTEESGSYGFWVTGPAGEGNVLEECFYGRGCFGKGAVGQPFDELNLLTFQRKSWSQLSINADCGVVLGEECKKVAGDANGYAVAVYLYAADITLEQTASPSASNVSGELATALSVAGTSDLAFDASDPGSGVYEAVFNVDGQVVQSTVLDSNGGHCQNVGGTSDGLPAFLYLQPCAPSVTADVPFDTTQLSNGAHHLVVSVTDAAGNSATVLDREITVDNPPPPGAPGPLNGTNASAQATLDVAWVGSKKARISSAYGRAHTIAGRLTAPGGVPIAGAQIDCTATPATQGAHAAAMVCPKTGANGQFTLKVPGGQSSRTLALAYYEHIGDAQPVAMRTLGLTVKAGVRLRVSPHTTSVAHTIHFTGTLLGQPIPHGGKQLVLEARSPGSRWIEFDVVRTNGKGRYRDSYTFKFPGPVNYRFRAVSESEADYPFATGASNTARVFER